MKRKIETNGFAEHSTDFGLTICNASLGIVGHRDVTNINHAVKEIGLIFERHHISVVYKLLYPGKLWIKREPITEIEMEIEGDQVGQTQS